jgi:hypothetical protein
MHHLLLDRWLVIHLFAERKKTKTRKQSLDPFYIKSRFGDELDSTAIPTFSPASQTSHQPSRHHGIGIHLPPVGVQSTSDTTTGTDDFGVEPFTASLVVGERRANVTAYPGD